ncbi:MAG: hypothetical protein EON55_06940 [Alphaproteobacteria bacterium]|nr:MAG: hypothetical protein EON55_06940 [Alphaproteobacteria bacterium]
MVDHTDKKSSRWRVHWSAPSTEQAGITADADGLTTLWVGSDDPVAIKAFVAAQNWAEDAIIEVSVESVSGLPPSGISVLCRPIHVGRWDPTRQSLPVADPSACAPRSRSQGRLALLQAVRRGVDEAVAAGTLHPEDGAGLMLIAQEALDRHERRRQQDEID